MATPDASGSSERRTPGWSERQDQADRMLRNAPISVLNFVLRVAGRAQEEVSDIWADAQARRHRKRGT